MADKSPQEQINEVKDLVVGYAKQETIDPLKGLLRTVGVGLLAAFVAGIGVVFLAIALLRLLQTETPDGLHRGNWSVLPYLFVFVALIGGGALAWFTMTKAQTRDQTRDQAKAHTSDNAKDAR